MSDVEARNFYDQNVSRYTEEEQRRASHILITVAKDASVKEKSAAQSKVEQLLKQLHQTPASFAKLAKEYSQDPGSATQGGDLGFFGKGMMVKPVEIS